MVVWWFNRSSGGGNTVGCVRAELQRLKDYKYNIYVGASRTCPLYIFDSDMETHVNMRRGVMDGLDRVLLITT